MVGAGLTLRPDEQPVSASPAARSTTAPAAQVRMRPPRRDEESVAPRLGAGRTLSWACGRLVSAQGAIPFPLTGGTFVGDACRRAASPPPNGGPNSMHSDALVTAHATRPGPGPGRCAPPCAPG